MFGLHDVWRWKYPQGKQFTCHSATHVTLSRIDLIYVSDPLLARVRAVTHLSRGISDYAPVLLDLSTDSAAQMGLSRYWITNEKLEPILLSELRDYWTHNDHLATPDVVWDAFKAYARR